MELGRFPRPARAGAAAAVAVMLAGHLAVSLVRSPEALGVALGLEDREDYLLRHEPTYLAATLANHLLRSNGHLLSQEPGSFYFDCPVTWENSLEGTWGDPSPSLSVRETVVRLRRAGFTHLLLAETAAHPSRGAPSPLRRVADAETTVPVTDYCFRTADGNVRHYRLVVLR